MRGEACIDSVADKDIELWDKMVSSCLSFLERGKLGSFQLRVGRRRNFVCFFFKVSGQRASQVNGQLCVLQRLPDTLRAKSRCLSKACEGLGGGVQAQKI